MTKPKTRSDSQPTADELRARLDGSSSQADADSTLPAQVDFWSRLRTALAANNSSSGLGALDELALAALADDPSTPLTLTVPAVLLPSPDLMSAQGPPEHALFFPASDVTRAKRPSKQGQAKPKAPPAKKRRTSVKPRASWFQLPSHAPKRIKLDLVKVGEIAAEQDTTPERLAYRWRGQRAWYDPVERPDLHLVHWRFVMRHRATFLILAVYAPTDDSGGRRKQKSAAYQARLVVLSYNIEEFGYYGFLERFENSAHDHLMWLGGKASKHSVGAKKVKDQQDDAEPPQDDLAKLLRRDPDTYERVIDRILDPGRVDEEGYSSITELLTLSNALDPTRPSHLRLSTKALARIVLDVTTKDPPNPSWVGNRTVGPWKKLLSDTSLRPVQLKLSKRLRRGKSVVSYGHKPFNPSEQRDNDSDFEEDGSPVIQPPTPPVSTLSPDATRARTLAGLFDSCDDEEEDGVPSHSIKSDDEEAPIDVPNNSKGEGRRRSSSDESEEEEPDDKASVLDTKAREHEDKAAALAPNKKAGSPELQTGANAK